MVIWIFRILLLMTFWNCFLALLLALVWRPPRMPRTVTSRKIYMRLKALKLMLVMAIPPRWLYRIRTALLMLYGIASGLMALLILSCFRHLT